MRLIVITGAVLLAASAVVGLSDPGSVPQVCLDNCEVWVVGEEGAARFFADDEIKQSVIVPEFPDQL